MAGAFAVAFVALSVLLPSFLDVCKQDQSVTRTVTAEDVETVSVSTVTCANFQPTDASLLVVGVSVLLFASPLILKIIPPGFEFSFAGITMRRQSPGDILDQVEADIDRHIAEQRPDPMA